VSVATLPEGEDPDTIVQKQGVAALERVLKDAVDVLERKIQILERKGFFGTLPGRRRALDRLLPTIRAAADPITRELYISRVAEAANVRKDVLEREAGTRDGGRGMGGGPGSPVPRPSSPISLPASAERALLLLLLEGEPWRARVFEAVDPEEIEFDAYRLVYEAVADEALDRLDDTGARAYEALRAEGLGGRDPDVLFTHAVNWIEARRLEREIESLDRQIPLASPDEQVRLVTQKQGVYNALRAKFPRYKIAQRRSGAS
jgi:DNA primase